MSAAHREHVDPRAAARSADRHVPGEPAIWTFIFADLLLFTTFFAVFLYYRARLPDVFRDAAALMSQSVGTLNTLLLLTSSLCVAVAVTIARSGDGIRASRWVWGTVALGAGFIVVKLLEYAGKLSSGITPLSNEYFLYYFAFTGVHFVHVLLGLGVLSFVARYLRSGPCDDNRRLALECTASFWHVVDLLWIALFSLFYLLP